ncbi:MAG: DUF4058 family protein [Planctomycetes bacterium]|nr:DUF4058 family protein [Planctomycetota bacterium]
MQENQFNWQDAVLWRKVHNLWISELYHAVKPQVAGRLTLSIDQEVTLIELEEPPLRIRPDLHLSEGAPAKDQAPAAKKATGAVAYAEGVEAFSTESRHYLVLRDLNDKKVVGLLEILSPTNKGYYSPADFEAFKERRQRLLATQSSTMEIDAVPLGKRWLPRCLEELSSHAGVAWTSLPGPTGRHFKGWAWKEGGPLPQIPWELRQHGSIEVDLQETFKESLNAAGYASRS